MMRKSFRTGVNFIINGFKSFKKRTKVIIVFILVLFIGIMIIPLLGLKAVCPLINTASTDHLTLNENSYKNIGISDYNRPEESTYLTFPEWHLVYIPEEYANWLESERPSKFPYFSSMLQFWQGYCNVYEITDKQYGFNMGNHFMIWVIGTSSTLEYGIKGIYENTIGRFTEWTSKYEKTEEDKFAYEFNKEYADFLYDLPWYEFSFADKFVELWKENHLFEHNIIRKWERRGILSMELIIKTIYGGVIKIGTRIVYGKAPLEIYASVENLSSEMLAHYPEIEQISENNSEKIIKIPRYGKFTELLPKLSKEGVNFIDIAGNDEIFLTIIAPVNWNYNLEEGESLFEMKILDLQQPEYLWINH